MRWFYIASIYALAFTYSKIQFSSYLPQTNNKAVVRAPANGKDLSCKEMLTLFYPGQSKAFITKRLEANENFHSFFRAFAPLFYKEIKDNKEFQKIFLPVKGYKGTISGDLHVENFGFIIDDKGKVIYSLNDFDDVTDGELYQDLIRHFISSKIVDKEMSWKKYFAAYQKGLNNESHASSYYVEKGMEDVTDETEKVFKKYISSDEPFKFIKRKTPSRDTEKAELLSLKKALSEKFPKFEIFDHYVRIKEDGGSAGLIRHQVLGRLKPQDKLQWFDIKESAISGYDKANGLEVPFEKRVEALKENIYAGRLDESITVLSVGNHPYGMRAVDQFATSIKLEDISEDDYADIIQDQAYIIGQFHRKSLANNVSTYQKSWLEINQDEVEMAIIGLKDKLKAIYKSSL